MFNSGIFPRYLLFQHPVSSFSLSLVGAEGIKISKPWTLPSRNVQSLLGDSLVKGSENTQDRMQFRAEEVGWRCWPGRPLGEDSPGVSSILHWWGRVGAEQIDSGVRGIQILSLPPSSSVAMGLYLVSLGLYFFKCKIRWHHQIYRWLWELGDEII